MIVYTDRNGNLKHFGGRGYLLDKGEAVAFTLGGMQSVQLRMRETEQGNTQY